MTTRSKQVSRSKIKLKAKQTARPVYTTSQKTRIKRYNNRLLKVTKGDKITAREIFLVTTNDGDFYEYSLMPVINALVRKKKKGQLDPELAKLGFENKAKNAVTAYNRVMRSDLKLDATERTAVAQEFYEEYYPQIAEGEFD